jgi:hypothetical protein
MGGHFVTRRALANNCRADGAASLRIGANSMISQKWRENWNEPPINGQLRVWTRNPKQLGQHQAVPSVRSVRVAGGSVDGAN